MFLPLAYVVSFGPAVWLANADWCPYGYYVGWLVYDAYGPIVYYAIDGQDTFVARGLARWADLGCEHSGVGVLWGLGPLDKFDSR